MPNHREQRMTYLDHAATSWPKPPEVGRAIQRLFEELTANAGRSGHLASLDAARLVYETRDALAGLLGVERSQDLVFTRGATEGQNLVLKGFLSAGACVLVSPLEHNATMRPLARLTTERDVHIETLPADEFGRIDPEAAARRWKGECVDLVAVAHASNVNGAVQDIDALRAALPDAPLLIDAAQTAGVLEINVARSRIDFLTCSAHKGLLGPTGVGACYMDPRHEVEPLIEGGTGSRSESSEQPGFRPDRYESGTLNIHGIAGLRAALEGVPERGLLGDHKRRLATALLEGLAAMPRVRVFSPLDGTALLAAFRIDAISVDEVARRLETDYAILCRPGLHCAPAAHRHLGSLPEGLVRLAPGWGNDDDDVHRALHAIHAISTKGS